MRVSSLAVLLAACALSCGIRRIEKQPVPTQDQIRATALASQGDELLLQGKDHLALLKYLEASRLNPYHEVIFNKLAIAYSRLQQFRQAAEAVKRSIGLNRDYAFARNTRGIVYLASREYGKAVRSFRRAIERRPGEANFWVNLGHAYIRQDRFEEGIQAYRRALILDPQVLGRGQAVQVEYASAEEPDPERLYEVARIFARLGDQDTCLFYLGRALAAGFSDRQRLMKDEIFDPLRDDEDFKSLLLAYGWESETP